MTTGCTESCSFKDLGTVIRDLGAVVGAFYAAPARNRKPAVVSVA